MSGGAKAVIAFWCFVAFHLSAFWWPHWAQMGLGYMWLALLVAGFVFSVSLAIFDSFE
jgi:hypothetical protein